MPSSAEISRRSQGVRMRPCTTSEMHWRETPTRLWSAGQRFARRAFCRESAMSSASILAIVGREAGHVK